jgi:hypothetical protein
MPLRTVMIYDLVAADFLVDLPIQKLTHRQPPWSMLRKMSLIWSVKVAVADQNDFFVFPVQSTRTCP